jgi:5-methylcytosine-specific restriction endonuclease McrA
MNDEQKLIHKMFLDFRTRFREDELEFIRLLQETERTKLHRALGCSSVFKYAVDILAFSESVAYTYISVARKSLEFPQLMSSGLSVSKASRIVSSFNKSNADEMIQFALNHSTKEIDLEVARRNPKSGRERVKPLSDEFFEVKIKTSKEFPQLLKRVEALQAQRGKEAGVGAALEEGLREYLRRHDPVQKAQRAKPVQKLCLNRVSPKRVPLTAAQKHTVFKRDKGQCTHIGPDGKRCGSDRWIQIHHIRPVSWGGSNEPDNLTTLCSFHHDLAHQLSLPLDGQTTWLRSPAVAYGHSYA